MSDKKLPVYFVPHGGGPWPLIKDQMGVPEAYVKLERFLQGISLEVPSPKAIVLLSAHWESRPIRVSTNPKPPMLYDYGGFPPHTYEFTYAAPGHPEVDQTVIDLLAGADFAVKADPERGFDHGVFVPLMVAYPKAQIPIVMVSVEKGLDPLTHIKMGQALAPLREQNVLILGSGMTYHNMRGFFAGDEAVMQQSHLFDDWLTESVLGTVGEARNQALSNWESAPFARACHPQSEHLVPLFVISGAAGNDTATKDLEDELFGIRHSGFKFG